MAASGIVPFWIQGQIHYLQVHKTHPENHNPFIFWHLPAGWGTTPPSRTSNHRRHHIRATKEKKGRRNAAVFASHTADGIQTRKRTGSGRTAMAWGAGGKEKAASQGTNTCIRQMQGKKGRVRPHALVPLPWQLRGSLSCQYTPSRPSTSQAPSHSRRVGPPIPPIEQLRKPASPTALQHPPHSPAPSRSPAGRALTASHLGTGGGVRRTRAVGAAGAVSSWGGRRGRWSSAAQGGGERRGWTSPSRFAASTEAGRPPSRRQEGSGKGEGGKEEGRKGEGEKRKAAPGGTSAATRSPQRRSHTDRLTGLQARLRRGRNVSSANRSAPSLPPPCSPPIVRRIIAYSRLLPCQSQADTAVNQSQLWNARRNDHPHFSLWVNPSAEPRGHGESSLLHPQPIRTRDGIRVFLLLTYSERRERPRPYHRPAAVCAFVPPQAVVGSAAQPGAARVVTRDVSRTWALRKAFQCVRLVGGSACLPTNSIWSRELASSQAGSERSGRNLDLIWRWLREKGLMFPPRAFKMFFWSSLSYSRRSHVFMWLF